MFNLLKTNGYYKKHQFTIRQFHILCAECIYVFCIYFRRVTFVLYNINCLVLITEMENVYCAVRPGCLIKQITFRPYRVTDIVKG